MRFSTGLFIGVLVLAVDIDSAQAATGSGPVPGALSASGYIYKNPYVDTYPYNEYQTLKPLNGYGAISDMDGLNNSTLSIGGAPTPYVSASAAGSYVTYSTLATINYQVVVNGPSGLAVPLQIHTLAAVGGNTDTHISGINTKARVTVHADQSVDPDRVDLVRQLAYGLTTDGPYGQAGTLDVWDDYSALAGDVLGVSVYAEADIYIYDGTGTASAYADPYFRIDPAFLALHPDYSLSFSAGVSNQLLSSAPEPASWALLLTGFGMTGAALRRRRLAPFGV